MSDNNKKPQEIPEHLASLSLDELREKYLATNKEIQRVAAEIRQGIRTDLGNISNIIKKHYTD